MSRGRGRPASRKRCRARIRGEWYSIRLVPQSVLDEEIAGVEDDEAQTGHTESLRGLCIRSDDRREILVLDGQRGRDELDTLIHEMTHAAQWDLGEEAVEEIGTDLASALWRMGWRRTRR